MTTLLFVRHGQASFGHKDYDKLSLLGVQQMTLLGMHYAQLQRRIDKVVTGSLTRQQDSATHFLTAFQPQTSSDHSHLNTCETDAFNNNDAQISRLDIETPKIIAAFNEFHHQDVLSNLNDSTTTRADIANTIAQAAIPKVRLTEIFREAMQRWHAGENDVDYIESWSAFNQRVQQGLQQVTDLAKQQNLKTVLIFTSGGVIAAIVATLLGQGSQMAYQINRSLINAAVTTIVLKEGDQQLLSLNEHSHLYYQGKKLLTWH